MLRVTALWEGFIGAPGYSNFYFAGPLGGFAENDLTARAAAVKVRGFFNQLAPVLPSTVTISVQPAVGSINPASGQLEDEATVSNSDNAINPVSGQQTGPYASSSGACITWTTTGFTNGKRVKGRTFIVPLSATGYEDNGSLSPSAVNALRAAGESMVGSGLDLNNDLVVWHRPINGAGGSTARVTGVSVRDKPAILASRRD